MTGKSYKRVLLTASVLALCLCASCAGAADWTSVKLAGDYAFVRSNTESTALCLMETEDMTIGTPVTSGIAEEAAYDEDYILVKCRLPVENIGEWRNYFKKYYYIVDVNEEKVSGPYEKAEFEEACEQMEAPSLDWQSVDSLERIE